MNRKYGILMMSLVCCIALGAMYTTTGTAEALDDAAKIQMWGELDRQYDQTLAADALALDDDLKIRADDFCVTNNEYTHQTELAKLAGYSGKAAEERALAVLLERYAVYYCALREGYSVSEEELDGYVAACRADMDGAANIEDFYAYLRAREITEEEYWEAFKENRRYYCVIALYREPYYDAFCKEHPEFDPMDPDDAAAWEKYWNEIVEDAVAAEHTIVY